MLPLIPVLILAFLSFLSSAFIILRIVIPILLPDGLSKRVSPSPSDSSPNFQSLSPADKSHIWLALFDLLALAIFVWQAVSESLGQSAGNSIDQDSAAATRLWLALTIRQTCLLVVAALTLIHVRMGSTVSLGSKHWMIWAPTFTLILTSTSIAGALAGAKKPTFFVSLISYTFAWAVLTMIAFGWLTGTLILIRRNIAKVNEVKEPHLPAGDVQEKGQPSYATSEVERLRDGASWITSTAGSHRESVMSAFSFSTQHSREKPTCPAPQLPSPLPRALGTSVPRNSYPDCSIRPASSTTSGATQRRLTLDSQMSWFSSTSEFRISFPTRSIAADATLRQGRPTSDQARSALPSEHTGLLAWPTRSHRGSAALSSAHVLDGCGRAYKAAMVEKGEMAVASTSSSEIDVSVHRALGWFMVIWVPMAFSLPYLCMTIAQPSAAPHWASILLIISVTISSPILMCNIILRFPLPDPSGLFENYEEPPSIVNHAPSLESITARPTHDHKRSGSVTLFEGRQSVDVWIANGDAVDGKSKIGRALGMLSVKPKLSVFPAALLHPERTPTPPMMAGHSFEVQSISGTPSASLHGHS